MTNTVTETSLPIQELTLQQWLAQLPCHDSILSISEARSFQHDEDQYDEQYRVDPSSDIIGRGIIQLLKHIGVDLGGAALEVGCGTGVVSRGLVTEERFNLTILTDPSPQFVKITKRKVDDLADNNVKFAVLLAEDLDKLPKNAFSAIILRSVLHHVLDVNKFIEDASNSLNEGGVLVFEEPCVEGYVLMGAIAQFIPIVIEKIGKHLTESQTQQVQGFVNTMKFYADRVIDKSQAEDKHLFRVDELIKTGERYGLSTTFYPNLSFDYFTQEKSVNYLLAKEHAEVRSPVPFSFSHFFFSYLKYCMQFDEALIELLTEHFKPYCSYIDQIARKGNAPYLTGVFVCQKNKPPYQLQQAYSRIEAMESSKFWKLRTTWLRLKQSIGLKGG